MQTWKQKVRGPTLEWRNKLTALMYLDLKVHECSLSIPEQRRYPPWSSPCLGKASPKKLKKFKMTHIMNLTPSENRLLHFSLPSIVTFVQYFLNVVPIFWWQKSDFEKNINFCKYLFYHLRWHDLYCLALSQCQTMHILSPKY